MPEQQAQVPHKIALGGYVWGPSSGLGLSVAGLALTADQASKFWLVDVFGLAQRFQVRLLPMLDLVLTWNTGISYGLLQWPGTGGTVALLAFKTAAVILLWIWLSRSPSRLTAVALGLVIGGAIGNALDRLHWPGVLDFVLFHVDTPTYVFRWYVFNLADAAIVAGVAALLYDSLLRGAPQKRPDRG